MPGKTRKRQTILTGRWPSLKKNNHKHKHNHKHNHKHKHVRFTQDAGGLKNLVVPTFLQMLNTIKLYHWKTTSYSTHKATDDLYSKLNENIDRFVEVMLGSGGNRSKLLHVPMIKLTMASNNDAFKKQIEVYKTFLLNLSKTFSDDNAHTHVDLLAIRDEILADMNQFLYLLTLKD